ncbi:MAG: DUF2088 domain-containing protein [Chloroflexi bacterium]|nr:DUF2088 domain-containing protein [Chloroflexota bacterium]
MALDAQITADDGESLTEDQIRQTLAKGLGNRFAGKGVLVLIPDHTRTLPLPQLFRLLTELLADTQNLDFMVALGTHPPLDEAALNRLVGISYGERHLHYAGHRIFNHMWNVPNAIATLSELPLEKVKEIAGDYWHPSLGGNVPVRINRYAVGYDHVLICGPTFPHEVVGFSGGAKYLFPGISGPEMINVTHWLGALMTVLNTIGIADTPVRQLIHEAAAMFPIPITLISMITEGDGLAGMFIGKYEETFRAAAQLSSQRQIVWHEQPYQRVLAVAPPMYDELWVAAKAMYKLEPVVADGGELIIYAPHLDTVSRTHGKRIYEVGYHVRDYFLAQWERFSEVPLGVLAHSTHLKGSGTFDNGTETPRIHVTLASQIPADDCARLNLGYADPAQIDVAQWQDREADGVLYVPKAGEQLYRLDSQRI